VDELDSSPILKLEVLRDEVLRRNPTLAAMRHAWRAAIERYPQVVSLDDPTFSYGLAPATIGSSELGFGQKIDLSQRFPWPGKLRARGDAALNEADAAGEDVRATLLRLVEATDSAFYDFYYVHRAIEINDINRELLAELRAIAAARYSAGLVTKQDALQAEVAHEHLVHRGVVLERMRDVTVARINTLLNRSPATVLPSPPKTLPPPSALPFRQRLEEAALAGRPALRAQRSRITAREADVRLAQLEYFPNLTAWGTYNSLWEENERRPLGGVSINVPIQFGRLRAALDEARARLGQDKAVLERMEAEVRFELSAAADEVVEQTHVVHLYESSIVPAAEESLTAAQSGYESGANDFLTLIEAEKARMLAQLTHAEGLAEYHKARARLVRAVGISLEEVEGAR